MSENEVWIVFGTTGEYSDRDEWPVCVLRSEELAEKYVEALTRQYQSMPPSWLREPWAAKNRERISAHMTLDPHVRVNYTGTTWSATSAVSLTEREMAIAISKAEAAQ